MRYRLICHFMSWEIDYLQILVIQLAKSKYYFNEEVSIYFTLNCSDHYINWSNSKLPKQFFIDKFNGLLPLLKKYQVISNIIEGDRIYGHLDNTRDAVSSETDFYISLCPDMYFSEHLLYYLIESSKTVKNKYFVITPEIAKMWDITWDEITNDNFQNVNYSKWSEQDIFDIRSKSKSIGETPYLDKTQKFKWAGWFDLYSKSIIEDLIPVRQDWSGYGPYDYYGMLCAGVAKSKGIDIEQYVLRNQIIFEYSVGSLKDKNFSSYYKNLLDIKSIPNQRQIFESKLNQYVNDFQIKNGLV